MPLSHFQPEHYSSLLSAKVAHLLPRFQTLNAPVAEVFESPAQGFRLRAEFRVWHDGDDLSYVMFGGPDRKTPVAIHHFAIAAPQIADTMPTILSSIKDSPALRQKLFQIEFLTTLQEDLLVTLIYHRPLDSAWQESAEGLAEALGINIVGRSRKEKRVIGRDWVHETLKIDGRHYHYKQPEQCFSQPNGEVNQKMITWALNCARNCDGDLLELYCGVGNFTLPLAQAFDCVIATELSKPATAAAIENLSKNQINNVEFARLSAEEMSTALSGDRPFRRLAKLHKPLQDYRLTTLLVDPPRAGLDDQTRTMAQGFDNVIYVSCNPETLLRDLETLCQSHEIEKLAFFDQFPYTHHMESGVFLRRKST